MMEIHDHCSQCYNAACAINPLQHGTGYCCKVIPCPSGCESSLHECKLGEHLTHICANHLISCINSIYGCPHKLRRHKLKSHLHHCPASVVTCMLEWNRCHRSTSTAVNDDSHVTSSLDSSHSLHVLDIALAARDQKLFAESLQMPPSLRRSLRNTYTRNYPAVPFHQRKAPDLTTAMETSTDSLDFLSSDEEEHETSECYKHKLKPGVPVSSQSVHCSLCKARKKEGLASSIKTALNQIKTGQSAMEVKAIQANESTADNSINVKHQRKPQENNVDLVLEMFNSFRSKPKKMLTFLCAQDFRRDQFCDHYKSVHCDIQTGLNGWFQDRCPLAHYGCRFTQHRFVTDRQQGAVYNPVIGCFALRSNVDEDKETGVDNSLLSLPDLVLLIVFSYMDSLSLKNLAMTCKELREKCSYLLQTRGMVVLDWRKEHSAWKAEEKIWSFSTVFEKPQRWLFAERPSMADHLKSCPFNERREDFPKRYKIFEIIANVPQTDTKVEHSSLHIEAQT